jgi:hypothetical protein
MAIRMTIENTHAVCFPSKLVARNGGEHIVNLKLSADRDNGVIRGIGSWAAYDEYNEANAPAAFAAVIREQCADENWYVEVTTPADAVLVYEVPEFTNTYDSRFTDLHNWYNPSGKTVRAYVLHKGDIFELSKEGFTNDPVAGKAVSVVAATGKLTVAS